MEEIEKESIFSEDESIEILKMLNSVDNDTIIMALDILYLQKKVIAPKYVKSLNNVLYRIKKTVIDSSMGDHSEMIRKMMTIISIHFIPGSRGRMYRMIKNPSRNAQENRKESTA